MGKYNRRKDLNQNEVTQQLKEKSFKVIDTSHIGNGFPDMIIRKTNKQKALMVELKSKGNIFNLTEAEIEMQSLLRQCGCQICTAESAEEIIKTYHNLYG